MIYIPIIRRGVAIGLLSGVRGAARRRAWGCLDFSVEFQERGHHLGIHPGESSGAVAVVQSSDALSDIRIGV